MTAQFGSVICDPGPCDPGPLMVVLRDFGFWPLLLVGLLALVAGLKLSRANLVLPALCVAGIAAGFYVALNARVLIWHQAVGGTGDHPISAQLSERIWQETLQDYAIGFLAFALLPFGIGLMAAAVQGKRRRGSHA